MLQVYQCIKYHLSHTTGSRRLLDMVHDPLKSFFQEHILVTNLTGDFMRQEDFLLEYMKFYESLGLENFALKPEQVAAHGAISADAHLQSLYGITWIDTEGDTRKESLWGTMARALLHTLFLITVVLIVTVPVPFLVL